LKRLIHDLVVVKPPLVRFGSGQKLDINWLIHPIWNRASFHFISLHFAEYFVLHPSCHTSLASNLQKSHNQQIRLLPGLDQVIVAVGSGCFLHHQVFRFSCNRSEKGYHQVWRFEGFEGTLSMDQAVTTELSALTQLNPDSPPA